MDGFKMLRYLLVGNSLFTVFFGMALALFNQSPFFDFLFNRQINPVFWPNGAVPAETVRFQQFTYGVLGATMAGWGMCFAILFQYALPRREPWVWRGAMTALVLWYVTDSAISWQCGVLFNVAFNTIFFIALAIPLVLVSRYCRS